MTYVTKCGGASFGGRCIQQIPVAQHSSLICHGAKHLSLVSMEELFLCWLKHTTYSILGYPVHVTLNHDSSEILRRGTYES
jgi:hypothetical protein